MGGEVIGVGGRTRSLVEVSLAVASEDLAANTLIHLYDNGGVLTARKALHPTYPAHGFVREAFTSTAVADVWHEGRLVGLVGLTTGAEYYLSASTPGAFTTEAGTQWVGFASDDTVLIFERGESIATGVVLQGTLSANGVSAREARYGTLGAVIGACKTVYLGADNKWYLADASAAATATGIIGITVNGGNTDDTDTIMMRGIIRDSANLGTGTARARVYLSETAGAITETPPATSASVTRHLGWWEVDGATLRFEPSGDVAVHV